MVAPWIRQSQRTAEEKSFSISIAFARSSLAILSQRFFSLGSTAAFAARLTRAPSARSSSAGESISLAIAGKRARPQLVPSEGRGPASWSRRPKAADRHHVGRMAPAGAQFGPGGERSGVEIGGDDVGRVLHRGCTKNGSSAVAMSLLRPIPTSRLRLRPSQQGARALGWLGHRSITSAAVYTALAPNRFKDSGRTELSAHHHLAFFVLSASKLARDPPVGGAANIFSDHIF
jgi:hypothetical protein